MFSGPEGWTVAAQGVSPDEIHFRWSPKHQDLEVISTISLPIYLYAPGENKLHPPSNQLLPSFLSLRLFPLFPLLSFLTRCFWSSAPYLGNQLLSYGQNLSFSLRLDRGVHHPSNHDVILEGAGLQVGASLGDMSSDVTCGQKINYSFRWGLVQTGEIKCTVTLMLDVSVVGTWMSLSVSNTDKYSHAQRICVNPLGKHRVGTWNQSPCCAY